MKLTRLPVRVETLVAFAALYIMATANGGWWGAVWAGRTLSDPESWGFVACTFIAFAAAHFVLLAPFANRWTVRPLLTLFVVAAEVVAQYARLYAVILDPAMVQNVLKTDLHEASELINWEMIVVVIFWSAPALIAIWWVRIERDGLLRALMIRVVSILGAVVLAGLALWPVSRDFTSFMRNHREARYLITPANLIYGLVVQLGAAASDRNAPRTPLGTDARVERAAGAPAVPRVFVLVLGETARAANFSLFGYTRFTNPQLAHKDVLAFSNVHSCGTSTEVSVPCMFSRLGRADYNERAIRRSEGLLDVLEHAGYAVKWLDNQSGCKGVCQGAGVQYRKIPVNADAKLCHDGECHDEILVKYLETELRNVERDTVLVLHTMGNHGPAYFRRYPPAFRLFTPDCATDELRDCTRDEVVNAYDNAIVYTDFVVSRVVAALSARGPAISASMIYVSDHGESLGEGGLYLHGIPYSIAPSEQTHVPMIAWISPARAAAGIDMDCARGRVDHKFSHDNLFDTALGLLEVTTAVYKPERDIFAPCRAAAAPTRS
ncbi:MAG: phosphoethanolamine--lipid A transferase [Pseudomonadota bacterium]